MSRNDIPGTLRGVNVLDLCDDPAATIATWFLAEAGADVLSVRTASDAAPPDGWLTWMRSKRRLQMDLAAEPDREHLDGLLAGADIVVIGPADRRPGLDEATLRSRYPDLIVCVVAWYPDAAEWSDATGDELLIQARTGLMGEVRLGDGRPAFIRFPITTWGAAYLAANGILARLYQRERTGQAGVVRTSHLQGGLYFLSNVWTEADHAMAELQTKYGVLNRPHPWIFRCQDDRFIQVNVAFVDLPLVIEVLAEMGLEQPELTVDNIPEMSAFYADMFRRRPSQVWLDALHELDIDGERLQHVGEMYGDALIVDNGYTVDIDDPRLGTIRQAALPVEVDPPVRARWAAPEPDEHGAEIRAAGWRQPSRLLARLHSRDRSAVGYDAPPLAGLKVVDFGMNLSAPVCAKLLSDLGASVIKVERCDGGDRLRAVHLQFAGGNRGKRSIALKLGAPQTRPIVDQLVGDADIVVHNLRAEKARKLGIGYDELSALKPELVYAQVAGYGFTGPAAGWPARDPSVGAWSGWTLDRSSHSVGPIWLRLLIGDTGAAMIALFGVLLSLLKREVDGGGSRVRTSLLGAASVYASESYFVPATGEYRTITPVDERVSGTSPARRSYATIDGWVAVLAEAPGAFDRFRQVVDPDGQGDLDAATAAMKSVDLVAALTDAGVPAEVVRTDCEHEFLSDPEHIATGLVAVYPHPQHGEMRQPGQFWDFDGPRLWNGRPPPVFGQHTDEILDELGWPAPCRAQLLADGVIAGHRLDARGQVITDHAE